MGGGNTLGSTTTTTTIITTIIIITVEYNILKPASIYLYKSHGPHTKNNMPRAPYNTYIFFPNSSLRLNRFSNAIKRL